MIKLSIIKHSEISPQILDEIVRVKNVAWPYPMESQVKWLDDNLSPEDLHVLLTNEGKTIAYMNLVRIIFEANDAEFMAYGVGNVCAVEKHKGYGTELMNRVCEFLTSNRTAGMLFCKTSLVKFYERFGWDDVERDYCLAPHLPDDIHIMTYLSPRKPKYFKYEGKVF